MTEQLIQVASLANLSNPEGGDDPFQMEEAVIFAFTNDGIRILVREADAYLALEMVADKHLGSWELGIGIITTGWASPVPPDFDADVDEMIPPSEHALRRRVRLVSCVDKAKHMVSSLRFADDPDELITETSGSGSLANALTTAIGFMVARTN
jgi:hypothetical protein